MVCPVCAVGGIAYIASRIFRFPDVVVAFMTGMLATSMAYWGNHIMAKKWKKIKGQLLAINILSGIIYILT